MQLSEPTFSLLQQIEAFSGGKLSRGDDLGVLMEVAVRHSLEGMLADLSFVAKFLTKTHGILQRIGPDGEGSARLSEEFSRNLENARALLEGILAHCPADEKNALHARYLALTPAAMQEFMALSYDLSWYKNWLIDHP